MFNHFLCYIKKLKVYILLKCSFRQIDKLFISCYISIDLEGTLG
jgi:hypothetical protein